MLLVVSHNLSGIVENFSICPAHLVEEFSIGVRLHNVIRRIRREGRSQEPITFGVPYKELDYFDAEETLGRDMPLDPGQSALACSAETYHMPDGYFGLLQTKGSLARLFVSVTCNDGQIEPGYRGRITLEVTNHAPFPITIPVGSPVAQLYLFRCSTEVTKPYDGKYQNADGPTLARF